MDLQQLANIAEIVGMLVIAITVIFLTLQIQQNTILVRAELNSNAADSWIDIDASKQSESFASTLAKSIENPQELTAAEILELDGYLFTYIDQIIRGRDLYNLGIFDRPLELLVRGSLPDFFGNKFARAWWAETKGKFGQDIVEIIDRVMETISVNQDIEYIEQIKARLSN